ncbi:MAG: 2,5-dihydroxypyridine 5,6-dioxygenase [Thermoanaerobacteraceae bacterium]|nr:2,5-dihydroxypyridine 5,6-dioxygenase [Thermoanaerobacteraceae bacterium]MDN5311447.1 2,5-dihydroxypyridine 5,6-dioxygenase [Thermoanaerobacteraceae bacterium]
MARLYEYELAKSADILMREMFKLKPGETIVITADTESDERVGAKLTGNVLEDERVWGSTEWGLGYLSPIDAPPDGIKAKSHCDGICMNSTVWLDEVKILDNGIVVHPELASMIRKLGR